MNRQAQAVVLLLLGGAVVRASLTDLHLRYVKEGLRPFLIAAGLLLVAAAVMTLFYELRPLLRRTPAGDHDGPAGGWRPRRAPAPDAPGDGDGGHDGDGHEGDGGHGGHDGHGHREPRVGWLLILPVLGLLLVAPPALGSYAAGQAGTAVTTRQQPSDYPPLPAGDPVRVAVLDYASRALFDQGTSIGERRVQLTGFVTTGPDGRPLLARMVLSCCAADGRPVKLGLTGAAPDGLADDTWIEVTGRYSDRIARDPVNDAEIPYLDVESWRQVPVPRQQYE
ncbi:TIGR03943 family protein [Micromonospora sp. DSM 115977]|uniref:TIGR03943 family protein n=1 Tax=Micromonospora reichwaldensis TaxID=3075516 RepID=A0ABU2X547_9ACTN|nr:TIGR03943 family protein [Micromonospora sp. DSM 115977]MDT0533311.1 TIGR03943 family protein [Micromonospora sp. DSM 115977]